MRRDITRGYMLAEQPLQSTSSDVTGTARSDDANARRQTVAIGPDTTHGGW